MKKKIMAMFAVLLAAACIGGCGDADSLKTTSKESGEQTDQASGGEAAQENGGGDSAVVIDQTGQPQKGDQIAVMEIAGMGQIRIRLFPEAAPKAVENFVTHAKDGYYNGVTFHRVADNFMIQGGDPTGTGAGGESIWGEPFEDEFNESLMPIRGALCMANSGENTNGSQFFIVQTKDSNLGTVSGLTEAQEKLFEQNGGTPWLVYKHTVFGQVIEGMDVVDAIAAVETTSSDKPVEDVVISGITIEEY